MDDSEHVCPLCCEELDISDREFYPCKCGYQVCMWCWHRIRESESGLCPACRTPYGEDPHQFSAVDVEEVLRANKEKEAALKRQKQQEQAAVNGGGHHHHHDGIGGGGGGGNAHHRRSDSGDHHLVSSSSSGGGRAMEVPKDRSQLANMRVIRRNLVYAVGLLPHLASEDTLRKPEFFGQYGKISKIVLNRAVTGGEAGSGRRASASAYVTFVHKEDTLACILALDGFYLENRNIRASYGTSKYCSAFIKNVRCNNPECTYLHEMGAAEDTFTKQEIQAGYVTSGRDVLARQQQIVAEQLRHGSGSSGGVVPRKRVGGGGPSGTGRACANPVFPAPEYDEPAKPSPALVPPPVGVSRAMSAVTNPSLNAANISAKLGRSNSVGTARAAATGTSPTLGAIAAVAGGGTAPVAAATRNKSAASIVAGVHSAKSSSDADNNPHTTLTPLTPLKRVTKATSKASAEDLHKLAPPPPRAPPAAASAPGTPAKNKAIVQQQQQQVGANGLRVGNNSSGASAPGIVSTMAAPAAASNNNMNVAPGKPPLGPSSIGGDVIGGPSLPPPVALPGRTLLGSSSDNAPHSSALGGEVFTGQLHNNASTIGRGGHGGGVVDDKWNSNQVGGVPLATSTGGLFGNAAPGTIGGGAPGSGGGTGGNNSSSALASILGVNLPTGSGSLRESNFWPPSAQQQPAHASGPSQLAALNGSAVGPPTGGVIGGGVPALGAVNNGMNSNNNNNTIGSSLIGGVPIGGGPSSLVGGGTSSGPIGGSFNNGKSDIALLQSLLPGVHITSGNEALHGSGGGGIVGAAPGSHHHHHHPNNNAVPGWNQGVVGSGGLGGETLPGWGGVAPTQRSSAIGAIGQSNGQQNQRQQAGPGIW